MRINEIDRAKLYKDIFSALQTVIEPETSADVIRLRLVLDLNIHNEGTAAYIFRPSSPLCPIALPMVLKVIEAFISVDGVLDQKVTVINCSGAEEINKILASLPLSKFLQIKAYM